MDPTRVNENSSFTYECDIRDGEDDPIAAGDLTTLTLTLYDRATGTILNSRDAQNALNANNVTVDTVGHLVWSGKPADSQIVGSRLSTGEYERHIALFEWTYNGGSDAGNHEIEMRVIQMENVP